MLVEQKDNIKYNCWCHPSSMERQKSLDKLHQPPYHETEGIQLSSSVQIKQQENNVVGVLFLIFCTMCTLCLHNISGFLPI